jgi:4-aminobutyrate aminotransferase-like enzyme/Ser/Thr protein kinase RdoA (MazF antagonist)
MTDAPLIALEARTPVFSAEEAGRIARSSFGIDGTVTALYGERDQNFHIRPEAGDGIVLKFIGSQEDPAVVDLQTAVLQHIAEVDPGLPVPRIVPTLEGAPHGMAVDSAGIPHRVRAVAFQPGQLLDRITAPPELLGEIGRTVARLDRALRGFFHPAAAQPIVWDLRRAGALRPHAALIADAGLRDLVERGLDRFLGRLAEYRRLPAQVIHNDCHPGNLLVDPGATKLVGILDFGDLIHGPTVFDAAVPAAEVAGVGLSPLDSAARVIVGYDEVSPLEEAEIAALYDAIVARHAISLAIHAWRGRHDPAGADKLGNVVETNARALDQLLTIGAEAAIRRFRDAVAGDGHPSQGNLVERRRRLLGDGLELSYRTPFHPVRGEGVLLFDAAGQDHLDAYNNVPSVGHGNPEVAAAIGRQMRRLCANTRYLDETVLDYAERLTATMPAGLDACLFVNSGSEANDAAWRIAKAVTGRSGALVMSNAYHGITDAVAALSPYYGTQAVALAPHVQAIEAPDTYRGRFRGADAASRYAEDADRAIAALHASGHGLAALIVDSAFVSNGIIDVPPGWLEAVAAKVRAAGGLVIGDEVQSGFGRMGDALWGFQVQGFVPDLVTLGKPMANGHPVGAVVTGHDVLRRFTERVEFFSTFGGNPVSAAAALATLGIIQRDGLQANARETGALFRRRIAERIGDHPAVGDIRGRGLMIGVDIVVDRDSREPSQKRARTIANAMRDRRVLIGTEGPHGNVLKIRPPLPFGPPHVERAVAVLAAALEET